MLRRSDVTDSGQSGCIVLHGVAILVRPLSGLGGWGSGLGLCTSRGLEEVEEDEEDILARTSEDEVGVWLGSLQTFNVRLHFLGQGAPSVDDSCQGRCRHLLCMLALVIWRGGLVKAIVGHPYQ